MIELGCITVLGRYVYRYIARWPTKEQKIDEQLNTIPIYNSRRLINIRYKH